MLDAFAVFSDAQGAITATAVSTNSYDTKTVGPALGNGEPITVEVSVHTTGTGSGTVDIQLVHADVTALTTNVAVLASTGVQVGTTLVAGNKYYLTVPAGTVLKKHLGVKYVVASTVGAVKFNAHVVGTPQNNEEYHGVA